MIEPLTAWTDEDRFSARRDARWSPIVGAFRRDALTPSGKVLALLKPAKEDLRQEISLIPKLLALKNNGIAWSEDSLDDVL